ncbi:MAG: OPT/YSL family transporter, partial [Spongiibacteraceae bacterium]|nr:OPT/YSL family transporter [Spongiibacteraceae bacterium]
MSTPRELSPRALTTGLLLGLLLTPCNVYAGLKIGWSFNKSNTALLLGAALWRSAGLLSSRLPPWSPLESNINQTAASACASIV